MGTAHEVLLLILHRAAHFLLRRTRRTTCTTNRNFFSFFWPSVLMTHSLHEMREGFHTWCQYSMLDLAPSVERDRHRVSYIQRLERVVMRNTDRCPLDRKQDAIPF